MYGGGAGSGDGGDKDGNNTTEDDDKEVVEGCCNGSRVVYEKVSGLSVDACVFITLVVIVVVVVIMSVSGRRKSTIGSRVSVEEEEEEKEDCDIQYFVSSTFLSSGDSIVEGIKDGRTVKSKGRTERSWYLNP